MTQTQLHIRQVRLGPEVPLGRRGCIVESSKTHKNPDGWADSFFAGAVARGNLNPVVQLLRSRGEEVFTVIGRIAFGGLHSKSDFNVNQQVTLEQLMDLGIVLEEPASSKLQVEHPRANWGAGLECAALISLDDLYIQAHRDVKVKYPYGGAAKYDPDGQKYDVLAGLDLSRLLWLECKKPLYSGGQGNPLRQVLSIPNIEKFYRRAHYLKPDIAVYLVDTLSDYRVDLTSVFTDDFIESGCYMETPSTANHLVARLHGFIYFVRVDYGSTHRYMEALRQSISQVLHDTRHDWIQLGYSGDPFQRAPSVRPRST
jgi:hypothetical protein